MHDAWRWQIALNAAFHLLPCEAVSRTTPSQALKPETTDLSIEDLHGPRVSGHPVVGVVPSQHGPQPSSITVDGPVHARAELFLDLSEFGEPAATFRLSPDDEGPVLSSAVTKVCEPEEVERFRSVVTPPASASGSEPAELDQTGLIGVQTERETGQPFLKIKQEAFRILPVLKASDAVIGIAHDNHIAGRLASPPLLGPEIKRVMKVDVRQEWRNHRFLAEFLHPSRFSGHLPSHPPSAISG